MKIESKDYWKRTMKYKYVILTVMALMILSYSVVATEVNKDRKLSSEARQDNTGGITSTPTLIPGHIFTGSYIRVGINNAGTLGVTGSSASDPGVGFQSSRDTPFSFPSTESAAIWWWGEGYNIAYAKAGIDTVAYWQPGNGYPPSISSNIVPVSNAILVNNGQEVTKEVIVKTRDNNLKISFIYTLLKRYPALILKTTFTNDGTTTLDNVVYKRIVDWDVCTKTPNQWISTDRGAYARANCDALAGKMIELSISGYEGLTARSILPLAFYTDLDAWDDQTIRGPKNVVRSVEPINGDYNAAIYYRIGKLLPGNTAATYTVYQSNFPEISSVSSTEDVPLVDNAEVET